MIRWMGWILALVLTVGLTVADPFTPKTGRSALHENLANPKEGQKSVALNGEQGQLTLNLSGQTIHPNSQGRQPHVALISIPGQIGLEMGTVALNIVQARCDAIRMER